MVETIHQITKLCWMLGIKLYRYSDNAELLKNSGFGDWLVAKGFACQIPGRKPIIFFDDGQTEQEIRYTIAHELGHILHGHLQKDRVSLGTLGNSVMEREADSTAAVLLDLIYGSAWQEESAEV